MPYGTIVADKITTSDGYTLGGTGATMKNRLINGAMVIDQRNAGASVTALDTNLYTLDRWQAICAVSSKYTVQQNAGSVTPPAGFVNYLGVTSSSAYTVGSTEYFFMRQRIEGYNIADLGWGTANAKTVTLSFWVRSSLTGTFGGAIRNNATDRAYPFSYTISSANTWEQKTITISGETTGTWLTTNGVGMNVDFGLGVGSTYQGTANAWASANYLSPTGSVSVVGTSGATFYITGVQLEAGSTATSFDYRDYSRELAMCQRYFYQLNSSTQIGVAACYSSGNNFTVYKNPVSMRTAPAITNNSASGTLASNGTTPSWSSPTLGSYSSVDTLPLTFDGTTTAGYAYSVRMTSGSIAVSAEL